MTTTKGVELLQKIEFKRHAEAEAKAAHLKLLEANRPRTKVVITNLPSSRDEWEKESQAGVTFWKHNTTGEIKMDCPYEMTRPSTANQQPCLPECDGDAEEEATGALVYDNAEYQAFVNLLGELLGDEAT